MVWQSKRRVVAAGFGLAVVILLFAAAGSYLSAKRLVESHGWITHTHQVLTELESTLSTLKDAETGTRGNVITADESFLESYTEALHLIEQRVRIVRSLTADNATQRARLDRLERLISRRLAILDEVIGIRRSQGRDAASLSPLLREGKHLMDVIREVIGEMEGEENHLLAIRVQQSQVTTRTTAAVLVTLVIISITLLSTAFLLYHREIAARLLAEQSARDAQLCAESGAERLNLAIDGANVGTWHWNVVSGELEWSDRCRAVFGIPAGEVMSYERFIEALHPEDRERTNAAGRSCLADKKDYDIEYRSVWPDGTTHWIAARGRGYYDAGGNAVRLEGVVLDIDDRKYAEDEIRRLNEELNRRVAELTALNSELEAFNYSVSHDLRAPLRAIDGFGQALIEESADRLDERGKRYLERVRAAAQRMGELIDGLLTLSRVTRAEFRTEEVDLSAMAHTVIADLRHADGRRDVEIVIRNGLVARGDGRLLRAVLQNLLDNAWKFTSKRPRARIEFGALGKEDGKTVYFVRDDGAGFDMKYADKLFGVFQRLHSMTEFVGTGIGLATVRRVIHRHGGRAWPEGEVDKGATIYFTL